MGLSSEMQALINLYENSNAIKDAAEVVYDATTAPKQQAEIKIIAGLCQSFVAGIVTLPEDTEAVIAPPLAPFLVPVIISMDFAAMQASKNYCSSLALGKVGRVKTIFCIQGIHR